MSDRRRLANRTNASKSTGPTSENGKAVASMNAVRHGIRSQRILLDDEDPNQFLEMQTELLAALRPVGAIETALADRIATAMWRQLRLARAEVAAIAVERREDAILGSLQDLHHYNERDNITDRCLKPFDSEQTAWCQAVIDEIEVLEEISLDALKASAPSIWGQFEKDAEEDQEAPEEYAISFPGGIVGFVAELGNWCRKQLKEAEQRPQLLVLAQRLREMKVILPPGQLEVIARYQTTLDNQLYKALRAFREAQEWRLKTIDGSKNDHNTEQSEAAA
jgi:hypothetical protein